MATLTIPTYLTLIRILLVVPLVFCISRNAWKEAALLLTVAALTDVLDGWIARTFNQVSSLGAFLDPLADKILILGCYYACALNTQQSCTLPQWFVGVLVVRELILMIGAFVVTQWYKIIEIHPLVSGKLTNFVQVAFLLHLMIANFFAWRWNQLIECEMLLVLAMSAFSLGLYIFQGSQGIIAWRLKNHSSLR